MAVEPALLSAGYLVHLGFSCGSLTRFELTPYHLYPHGLLTMSEPARAAFLQDMERISEVLRRPEDVLAVWDAFIDCEGGPAKLWRNWIPHISGLDCDPTANGPWLLNRLVTPAHRELYERATRRLIEPQAEPPPQWALDLVRRWRTLEFDQHMSRFLEE